MLRSWYYRPKREVKIGVQVVDIGRLWLSVLYRICLLTIIALMVDNACEVSLRKKKKIVDVRCGRAPGTLWRFCGYYRNFVLVNS